MSRPHISWPVCGNCEGYGTPQDNLSRQGERGQTCPVCSGIGRTEPAGWTETVTEPCRYCRGAGCEKCGGTGMVITRKGTVYYMDYEGMTLADALKATGKKAEPVPPPVKGKE